MSEATYPVMIDPQPFARKPNNDEVRAITNRLKHQQTMQHLTAEELRAAIVQGHTVCYGCFEPCERGEKFGHSPFVAQRLVAVDIDNTAKDVLTGAARAIEFWEFGFLTVPRAIDRAVYGLGQKPLIVYESFSSTETHPKFRLVFDIGETITDYAEAHEQILDVLATYPEADRNGKCAKPDALFFGTTPANGKFWDSGILGRWASADASGS